LRADLYLYATCCAQMSGGMPTLQFSGTLCPRGADKIDETFPSPYKALCSDFSLFGKHLILFIFTVGLFLVFVLFLSLYFIKHSYLFINEISTGGSSGGIWTQNQPPVTFQWVSIRA